MVAVGAENYTTVSYEDKPLTNYCFNPSTRSFALALSKSGDGRSCSLISYNDGGDKITTVDSEYGASSFSVYKGTMAVLDGNTIYAFNSAGELKYACDAGTGARTLLLTSDTSAYVLSVNQVRAFNLGKFATSDSAQQ